MWEARQLSGLLATLDLSSLEEATRGLPASRKAFEGIEKAVWGDMPTADGEPPAATKED